MLLLKQSIKLNKRRRQPQKHYKKTIFKKFSTTTQLDTSKVPTVYDLCVIGGGPAGFASASRAWDLGKTVCIVEKGRLGGNGVHNGALSSKTMWEISEDFKITNSQRRGFFANNIVCELKSVREAVFKAQEIKETQLQHQLEALAIPFYKGFASFMSPNEVLIKSEDKEDFVVEAKQFLIATGSKPRVIPDIPEDGEVIFTSDTIMNMKQFPKSIVILGGGVIGCEYATIFSNFKQTKVYLIDKADRILPFEDEDISELISTRMEKKGVKIHKGAKLVYLKKKDGCVEYCIEYPNENGRRETKVVDVALLSVGREPNIAGLELDKAGVQLKNGNIIQHGLKTSVPHIYICGDASPGINLVNLAELEGRHAIEQMFNYSKDTGNMTYDNISTIMFLDPKVSAVGDNEQTLQKKRIEYKIAVYHYSLIARSIAKGKPTGFIKLLVSNDDEMRILGVRALGQHSSTVVDLVSYFIKSKQSVRVLSELITAYPSMTEGLFESVRLLLESSILKPKSFPEQTRLATVTYKEDGTPLYSNIMVPGIKGKPKSSPRRVKGWPISMAYASFYDRTGNDQS